MSNDAEGQASNEVEALIQRSLQEPTLVTFFIPLPQPLGFPADSGITFLRPESVSWLRSSIMRVSEKNLVEAKLDGSNFVSIRFKRSQEIESYAISQMATACSHVDEIIDSGGMLSESMKTLQARVESTVLEATTVFIRPPSGSHNEALSDALERVFEEATRVLTAYRIETSDLAVDLLSRVQCVPMVPYVLRIADFDGDESFRRGLPGLYSVNDGESLKIEHFKERLDREFFDVVTENAYELQLGNPFLLAYHELFRARRACFLDGDFRSSVVSAFTGIEYFYNAILNLLCWESGEQRAAVRKWQEEKGFAARLKTYYSPLLGGNWDPNHPKSVPGRIRAVSLTRGSVVHAGYLPDEYEARRLILESEEIIDAGKELLMRQSHRFCKTAYIVFGSKTLQAQGMWTRRMREQVGDGVLARRGFLMSYREWLDVDPRAESADRPV